MSRSFHNNDPMISLISDNYQLIQVMTRFGINVGFGDKTVQEVCDASDVDCPTFLAVVNFIANGQRISVDGDVRISLPSLLKYLKSSHNYFLNYCLPLIRRKLIDAINISTTDVSFLILRLFDETCEDVKHHMEYEEQTVFEYIDNMENNNTDSNFHISIYSDNHEQVSEKFRELKKLIIKYCPGSLDTNALNDALYSIYSCEEDLQSHCRVEDNLLVPSIMNLEKMNKLKTSGIKS